MATMPVFCCQAESAARAFELVAVLADLLVEPGGVAGAGSTLSSRFTSTQARAKALVMAAAKPGSAPLKLMLMTLQ